MRAQVTRRTTIIVLVLSAGLMSGHQVNPAVAADPRIDTFRVLFPEGLSTPHQAPEHAERNRLSVQHIARMLAHWGEHPGIRFIFVASRPTTCGGAARCNPEHLLWQRLNETAVLLRTAAAQDRKSVRFDRVGQAFQDEFRTPTDLPPTPVGTSGIDLRTYVDAKIPLDGSCPWHLLVFDPQLPPVIGETDGKPAIPVAAGSSIIVSNNAVLRLVGSARRGNIRLAVWENERREFSAATSSIFATDGASLPPPPVRLHLLSAPTPDTELQRLSAELTTDFRPIIRLPASLQGPRLARGISKDMGDDVLRLPPGGLQPPRPEDLTAVHCQITFLPNSIPLGGSSR